MKKIFIFVATFFLLISFSLTTTFAAKSTINGDPGLQKLTAKQQEKFIEKINKGLEKVGDNPEDVKMYLLKNDFEPAEIDTGIKLMNHAAVTFTLEAYRNSKNGLYTFVGNWKFKSGQIDTSDSSEDVVSLSLWNTSYGKPSGIVWASYPTRLFVYDSIGNLKVNTSTHFNSSTNGFVWKYQDVYVYNGNGYTGQTGTAIMWANSVPTSTTLYGAVNYLHTYAKIGTLSSATVSGGSGGVNLSATFSGGTTGKQNFKDQITIYSWPSKYVE